ncbi:alanine racemase [Thermodesulforhabdus norvegica]|uniref:Alanine racemase n=1 Tax=Thermodesulforhabdus norvegica TaxID=39841 RepID=A0A1I4RI04_9BACT|nr:alanine racemase [Thermodesulforhabdus norvegica]SFM51550.1 alanine racemase [Thermodesulforhabdus norvegica]
MTGREKVEAIVHNWIEIDLSALRHNFAEIKRRAGAGVEIIPVVKNNAYGHGAPIIAGELVRLGVRTLAVSKMDEALTLRRGGINLPLLVLSGLEGNEYGDALEHNFMPVVFSPDQIEVCNMVGRDRDRRFPVHVKFDTGMGRLGFMISEIDKIIEVLRKSPYVQVDGVMTHFADADNRSSTHILEQLTCFERIIKILKSEGIFPGRIHASNSAAFFLFPQSHFNAVRPGLALYGPAHFAPDLKPVMSFKSRILQVKDIPAGHSVGYGRTFIAPRAMRIAVVSAGYGDGYFRCLSNKAEVIIRGVRCPIVGRVSMNLLTVDVSHVPDVVPDDEVVLLGSQGHECIGADELAEKAGTISYEIYCRLGANPLKRIVKFTGEEE